MPEQPPSWTKLGTRGKELVEDLILVVSASLLTCKGSGRTGHVTSPTTGGKGALALPVPRRDGCWEQR